MKELRAFASICLVVGLASCGSGSAPSAGGEAGAARAATGFLELVGDARRGSVGVDAERICRRGSAALRRAMRESHGQGVASTCEAGARRFLRQGLEFGLFNGFDRPEVVSVVVSGARGRARILVGDVEMELPLALEHGEWKVAGVSGDHPAAR